MIKYVAIVGGERFGQRGPMGNGSGIAPGGAVGKQLFRHVKSAAGKALSAAGNVDPMHGDGVNGQRLAAAALGWAASCIKSSPAGPCPAAPHCGLLAGDDHHGEVIAALVAKSARMSDTTFSSGRAWATYTARSISPACSTAATICGITELTFIKTTVSKRSSISGRWRPGRSWRG